MKRLFKISMETGHYIEDVIVADDAEMPVDCVDVAIPGGFYLPRWDGTQWAEGLPATERKQQTALSVISKIENIHRQKLYTDVEITFPSGPAVIQFRNEIDRINLSNVATGAMALVMTGQPNTLMSYRTLDNVIQQVPASQMMAIAMTVLNIKQLIVAVAWQHKDAIKAMAEDQATAAAEIAAYDFTDGW